MIRSSLRPFLAALLTLGSLSLSLDPLHAQFGPDLSNSGFGKNKIQYRDFDWQIYHSPHFNLYYYQQEELHLQKVVSFAESAYDQLSREFNFQIKDPIPLIFYATHSAFEQNNIILNFIPEGVGAFASPARFRMVMPIDLPDSELMQLMLHELTHIFQYQMLFQGSLAKAIATTPPTWFMEGMASYMAKDETQRDKMYLRDAVVNDRIPSVTRTDFGGFFAYRFGHAVFDFIEERWGKEGFLDFIFEVRNTIGSRVDRAVKRAFKLEPEDFDIEFRRWLRKKYLPQLVETGEPSDFGRLFRIEEQSTGSLAISPAASPSGDLVAALTAYKGDVDVVLFDTKNRRLIRNLTRGFSDEYQYLVAQELALGRKHGRDISFSADGNTIAVFAKREKGRSLLLIDVLNGGLREVIDMEDLEQQSAPAFSPDGRTIAFSAWRSGNFDIFLLDLESRTISNLTNDALFDGGPVFSPDGRSIAFVSAIGTGFAKLFRVDLDGGSRYALTTGESNDNDPVYSPDGKRLYFTSDRTGPDNIFSLDLATGQLLQYTDVVTGAFMPTVLREPEGKERLVFGGFWKGSFDLYVTDTDEPVTEPQTLQIPVEPTLPKDLPGFEPDIQVSLDDANKGRYGGYKFFLEDAQTFVGVNSDQSYLGQILLTFSDYLGDRRIFANLSSIDSFSNFNIIYADFSRRWNWNFQIFDDRTFFETGDPIQDRIDRGRVVSQVSGGIASISYPFTFYQRAELGVGYIYWKVALPFQQVPGGPVDFFESSEDFPIVQGALVGDSTVFANYGAVSGRRWKLGAAYGPDLDESGTLFQSATLEARQYIQVTDRSNLAFRVFAGAAEGNAPNPFYFGGLDTVRGVRFRSLSGDRGFFANLEYRFPLLDIVATPLVVFQGVRGVLFFDVGGAWFNDFEDFDLYDSDAKRFEDGLASYGFGVTVRFLGLDLNWDFAKLYKPPVVLEDDGFQTEFWIGVRF